METAETRNKKVAPRVLIAASVVMLGLAGALYASPYVALWQMRQALEHKDADALARRIDFPAVRESLTQQAELFMARESANDGLGMLGLMMGRVIVTPMIQAAASPAGIALMLESYTGAESEKTPAKQDAGQAATPAPEKPKLSYTDFAHFRVSYSNGFYATLTRSGGFFWTVTDLQLPLASLSESN